LDSTLLASLLSISQESLADIKYIRNKLADFKAITTVQRQILERAAPIINTWYTSGSVDLNIMVSNPLAESQKVPVKVYLPKEARMEHIIDNDGLDIQYDVQLDTLYAIGEFQLGPRESIKKVIKMRDIWQLAEEDLNLIKSQAENLYKQLEKTQFSAQGVLLKNDIETRIEKILRTQQENIASPADKIMTYRDNKESFNAVQKNFDELKNLVTQVAASRGFLGAFGGIQTIAIWGMIIAFVTGFGLLIMIFFIMWRHQIRIASGQLALQAQILSGGKLDKKTLAQIFADRTITPSEEKVLEKALPKKEIARISRTLQATFIKFIKGLLAKYGKKIITLIVAITLVLVLGYAVPRIFIKNLPEFGRGAKNFLWKWWGIDSQNQKSKIKNQNEIKEEVSPSFIVPPSPTAVTSLEITSEATPPAQKENSPSLGNPIFIVIKETPTGWLNVRREPSKIAEIISRINVGEKLEAVGLKEAKGAEKFGWYNIILPDAKTGWIYGEYVQIVISE
jgi:hypothetical protein